MKNKLLLTLILGMFLFSLAFVNAECEYYDTIKVGDSITLTQTCNDCTYINITGITRGNIRVLTETPMVLDAGQYTYDFTNATTIGRYNVQGKGDDTSGSLWCYYFEVTNDGRDFTTTNLLLYSIGLFFIVLMMVSLYLISLTLPQNDARDEQGNILQISWLKYLRPIIMIFIWALGLGVLFILANISLTYLNNNMLGDLLFALYKIAFWMTIVMLPIYSIWILVRAFQDREMKKLIERGVQIKSTP